MKPSLENGLTSAQFSSESVANIIVEDHDDTYIHVMESQDKHIAKYIWGGLKSVLWSISRREMVTKQTEGYDGQQQEEEEEIMVFQVLMLWPSDAIIIPILNFNITNTRLVPLSLLLVSFSQPLTKLLSLSEFSRSFHHI